MPLTIVRSLPENQWREFVHNHPHGNVFHSPELFNLFRTIPKHTPRLWAAVDDDRDNILALLLPVEVSLYQSTLLKKLTTRSVAYGGILYDSTPIGHEALNLLLTTYKKQVNSNILFTEFRHLFTIDDIFPTLEIQQFTHENHLNYLVDTSGSPEEIMQNIGKRTRKQIRGGLRKQQVTVEMVENRADIADCYQLIQKSYAAAQVYLADQSFFETVFDELHPLGMVKFWRATMDGISVAASIELPYKETVYGWYSGVDRAYSKFYPGELLMWRVLEWSAANGYKVYDFGGAGRPDEKYGVREFKSKFGGKLVDYGRDVCVHHPRRLQLSKLGYELYRRLR